MSGNRRPGLTEEKKVVIQTLTVVGRSVSFIAKEINRSRGCVSGYLNMPATGQAITEKKAELADMFEELSRRMMGSIKDEDILKINSYQRVIAASACADKMRLLRGESTANQTIILLQVPDSKEKYERMKKSRTPFIPEKM